MNILLFTLHFSLFTFPCLPAFSQSMVVNTTSAGSTAYPTSQVESVVFTEETTEPVAPSAKIQMKRSIVFLAWGRECRGYSAPGMPVLVMLSAYTTLRGLESLPRVRV